MTSPTRTCKHPSTMSLKLKGLTFVLLRFSYRVALSHRNQGHRQPPCGLYGALESAPLTPNAARATEKKRKTTWRGAIGGGNWTRVVESLAREKRKPSSICFTPDVVIVNGGCSSWCDLVGVGLYCDQRMHKFPQIPCLPPEMITMLRFCLRGPRPDQSQRWLCWQNCDRKDQRSAFDRRRVSQHPLATVPHARVTYTHDSDLPLKKKFLVGTEYE